MLRYCLLCAKEFQIFGAINFAYDYKDDSNVCIDLFISNVMTNYDTIKKRLVECGLFENIYTFVYPDFTYKGISNKILNRILGLLAPRRFIKKVTYENVDIKKKKYDKIFVESLNHIAVPIILCSNCETIMLDDGIGSHVGQKCLNGYSIREWRLVILFHFKKYCSNSLNPSTIYLFNKNISDISWAKNIKNYTNYNDNDCYINLLKEVFSYIDSQLYNDKKIIYLGQWNFCKIPDEEFFRITNELLDKFNHDVIMRPHPLEFSYYSNISNLTMDRNYNLWELLCYDYIYDDNILISAFSSSMCMPKILYNREPTIIFTYPIFDNKSFLSDTAEKTYKLMLNSYKDKSKVILINTKEELYNCIHDLKEK